MRQPETVEVEFVKDLVPPRGGSNQRLELYRRGEQYLYVSTIGELSKGLDVAETAIVRTTELVAGMVGRNYPSSGEETMAFECDPSGEVINWGEVASARGSGSREQVLEQLREGVDLRDAV